MELVASNGDKPENVAIATLVYSALTFVAMALYGVETWIARGEAFSVYFNLFSRISPVRDARRRGRAAPAAGRARRAEPVRGHSGAAGGDDRHRSPSTARRRRRSGPGSRPTSRASSATSASRPQHALELAFLLGLSAAVLLVYGFYQLGIAGARSVGGGFSAGGWRARSCTRSCRSPSPTWPRTTSRCCSSKARRSCFLASDPLGDGSDLSARPTTRSTTALIGATATWYWQVGSWSRATWPALTSRTTARSRSTTTPAGRALAVLDARGDGRLHEPRAVAAGAGEHLSGACQTQARCTSPTPVTG